MTDTKTTAPEGIRILALRAGLTVPLAGPLDHFGVGVHRVLDRGQEADVSAAWVTEHEPSASYVRANSPDADEHRQIIDGERADAAEIDFQRRLQQATTAEQRAVLRHQHEVALFQAEHILKGATAGALK